MTFSDFHLCQPLIEALDAMGFSKPTPIQEQVIPEVLQGKDVIACAQTGTGKTAAYLLPVLHNISHNSIPHTSALIVAPTRELAQQIDQALQGFAYFTHASSMAVYGGNDGEAFEKEKKAMRHGASVIIATPGRLLSHLNMGNAKFSQLDCLILDEADKMLDMGFYDDIIRISTYLPAKRQTLLFSATMPSKIRALAKKMMVHPEEISIAISKPAEGILQAVYHVSNSQKLPLLKKLLEGKTLSTVLIFASTKSAVKELESALRRMNLDARAIHSDLAQSEREKVLLDFRNRTTKILVATDILSRGIDVENIGVVINYDVPADAEDYVHRVGRTARAETTGMALTFVNSTDRKRLKQIEELIGKAISVLEVPDEIRKIPESAAGSHRGDFRHKGKFRKSHSHR